MVLLHISVACYGCEDQLQHTSVCIVFSTHRYFFGHVVGLLLQIIIIIRWTVLAEQLQKKS